MLSMSCAKALLAIMHVHCCIQVSILCLQSYMASPLGKSVAAEVAADVGGAVDASRSCTNRHRTIVQWLYLVLKCAHAQRIAFPPVKAPRKWHDLPEVLLEHQRVIVIDYVLL